MSNGGSPSLRPLSPAMGAEVIGLDRGMLRQLGQNDVEPDRAVETGETAGHAFGVRSHLSDARSLRSRLRTAFAASRGLLLFRSLKGLSKDEMILLAGIFGTVEASELDGPHETLLDNDSRVHVFSKVPSARVFDRRALTTARVSAHDGASAALTTARAGTDTADRCMHAEIDDEDRYDPVLGRPSWHTDQSFRSPPPRASLMYCVSTPSQGGDTIFASTIGAWESLPTEIQSALMFANATHSLAQLGSSFRKYTAAPPTPPTLRPSPTPCSTQKPLQTSSLSLQAPAARQQEVFGNTRDDVDDTATEISGTAKQNGEQSPQLPASSSEETSSKPTDSQLPTLLDEVRERSLARVVHAVAPIHRATGKRALYLSPQAMGEVVFGTELARHLVTSYAGGRKIADFLTSHATSAKFRYRHKWRAGDLVVWDNWCTLHAATRLDAAFEGERRMWRSTVQDDGYAQAGQIGQMMQTGEKTRSEGSVRDEAEMMAQAGGTADDAAAAEALRRRMLNAAAPVTF